MGPDHVHYSQVFELGQEASGVFCHFCSFFQVWASKLQNGIWLISGFSANTFSWGDYPMVWVLHLDQSNCMKCCGSLWLSTPELLNKMAMPPHLRTWTTGSNKNWHIMEYLRKMWMLLLFSFFLLLVWLLQFMIVPSYWVSFFVFPNPIGRKAFGLHLLVRCWPRTHGCCHQGGSRGRKACWWI